MRKPKLARLWVRWRRYRKQAICAQGIPSPLAWQLASAEAATRQKVARVIGFDAASKAELTYAYRAGELRFMLIGNTRGLRDDQLERLRADVAIIVP